MYLLYSSVTCTGHGDANWNTVAYTVTDQRDRPVAAPVGGLLARLSGDGIQLPAPSKQMSAVDIGEGALSTQRSLATALPPWCSFLGVACDQGTGSSTYASVISIELTSLSLHGTVPNTVGLLTSLLHFAAKAVNVMVCDAWVIFAVKPVGCVRL